MKNVTFIFSIVFAMLAGTLSAGESTGITIDNDHQQLVAPYGEGYLWYRNGKILFTQDQRVKISKSGLYRVVYTGRDGLQKAETIQVNVSNGVIRKVYIIGDSTVQTYDASYYPQNGWGQVFSLFFDNSSISVINKAIGGRSSRSFWEEGRWTEVMNLLNPGDYVFIQFGHNDRDWTKEERYTDTAAYKDYLRIYVNETRIKGATPVLVSPMIMNAYSGLTLRNVFTEGENDYRGAMAQVADELNAPFVDLNMKSYERIKDLGQEYATNYIFLGLLPGEYPNYPDGKSDGTHFQEMGALEMARLIIEGIKELENDTNMTFLINTILPNRQMNISMNCLEAGLVTHSGKYPAGAPITLKTRLKAGYHFNHWEDTVNNIISTVNLHKFTMPAHDTVFIASVNDCNGDAGGSAFYDDCGSCSGGNTGITPCIMAFQSENACFYDGVVGSVTFNDYKRYYINTLSYNGPGVTYSIDAPADTVYLFGIVYSNVDNLEKLDVIVNGDTTIRSMVLDTTIGWNTMPVELYLQAGINIVKVVSQSSDGGILFDLLAVYSEGLSRGSSCRLQGIRESVNLDINVYPNPSNTGYTISLPGKFEYRVYNALGSLLARGICYNACYFGKELKNGLYLLQTIQGQYRSCQLIFKEP